LTPPDVIYADDHLIVLNKPSGLLAVPGKTSNACLSLQVQAQFADALIVHRLDMATSGLMVMARGIAMQRLLNSAFSAREVHKRYVAVVQGDCRDRADGSRERIGLCSVSSARCADSSFTCAEPTALPAPGDGWHTIDLPIIVDWPNRPLRKICLVTGKPSSTRWRCVHFDAARNASRLELEPVTGRLLAIGHPILGDALYAPPDVAAASPRLLLHAAELAFDHPATGERVSFHTPDAFEPKA
jgi:tRNA pseudouridine32 synthase / 23S rRNA pseudouridine746 synthase